MDEKTIKNLINAAVEISSLAYVPYSKFPVGCVIALKNGQRFFGVNIENASYPVALCAERSAMAHVVTAGLQDQVSMVVVTTPLMIPGTPCGMCRQFLSEFLAKDTPIICANAQGDRHVVTMGDLLPRAFTKSCLIKDSQG